MDRNIIDIDHLMVAVDDSQQAGDQFTRLGFTVTERSILPGLSNRLVCFGPGHRNTCNYIELMALDDASTAPPPMPTLLPGPERPVSLVMSTSSAAGSAEYLGTAGIEATDVIDLKRDWPLPSGEVIQPEFSVVIPTPGQAPFYWNLCQHKTPQHYARPEFTSHQNGARRLTAIIAIADAPSAVAGYYQQHWGAAASSHDPVAITVGDVSLRIYSPSGFQQAFPGIKAPHKSGLAGFAVASDHKRLISPDEACGCLIVFEPRSS